MSVPPSVPPLVEVFRNNRQQTVDRGRVLTRGTSVVHHDLRGQNGSRANAPGYRVNKTGRSGISALDEKVRTH